MTMVFLLKNRIVTTTKHFLREHESRYSSQDAFLPKEFSSWQQFLAVSGVCPWLEQKVGIGI